MKKSKQWEAILWSIALPGFSQLLNRAYIKGLVLLLLEFVINVNANLNVVIMASFHGKISEAISQTNFQWLLFYPCIYLFAIWDAYRSVGGGDTAFSFLPFVFSAFLGTIGVIYSPTFRPFDITLGPIFLPILCLIIGAGIGWITKLAITR